MNNLAVILSDTVAIAGGANTCADSVRAEGPPGAANLQNTEIRNRILR